MQYIFYVLYIKAVLLLIGEMNMKENSIELLAPSGSIESLHAAVLNGADAVYMGGTKFSARAYANNFTKEELKDVVDYCHIYGVKVYITLNILIKENEIDEVIEYVEYLYTIGVDALIIQDMAAAFIIKSLFQDLEIHASTQMTIHNAEGALFLTDLGFKRIVLSRELSLEEIGIISKEYGIETEIFIHGALCICYSGQCLMSSIIGGRSGNRGRCAQPCRLPYTLIDRNSSEERAGFLLSPKDMWSLEHIKDFIELGVSSLKIEGRMKRPEYVAGVVSSYRKALDTLNSEARLDYNKEKKKLLKLFNREGFSKAYLKGNIGAAMMSYKNPKNTGIYIGKVEKDMTVILTEDVSINDGITSGEEGFSVSKIIKGNSEVREAFPGDRVKLYPVRYNYRDNLFKTSDYKLLEELSQSYRDPLLKKVKLDINMEFSVGEPMRLSCTFGGKDFSAQGDIVQKALSKPLTSARIEENLKKSGDSPLEIQNVKFLSFQEGFAPISAINSLRRKLIEDIMSFDKEKYRRTVNGKPDIVKVKKILKSQIVSAVSSDNMPENIICVSTEQQLKAAIECKCKNIAVETFKRNVNFNIRLINEKNQLNLYLKIPNIIKQEFNMVCNFIDSNLDFIKGIITSNFGIIRKYSGIIPIIGDYKLNVYNSVSAELYRKYINMVPLSIELNKKEILSITKNTDMPLQMFIYGRPELMVSEYCAIGSSFGDKCSNEVCSGMHCTKSDFYLKDRKGEKFILKNDVFCRSYIYNSSIINLLPMLDEIKKMGISHYRLDFIEESYEDTVKILNYLINGVRLNSEDKYTKGHFKRGVE
jgi:U32 family peptidase